MQLKLITLNDTTVFNFTTNTALKEVVDQSSVSIDTTLLTNTSEIYGRSTGICKGRGGSMHISDFDRGMLGSFGIVAAGPPVVLGAALQEKINGINHKIVL